MAWTDVANQRLGAQAPAVISYLNNVNPNLDWTQAINEAADWNQQQYPDGGWQDPARGSSAMIAAQIGQKAANMPSLAPTQQAQSQLTSQWNSLAKQGMQQAEAIQKEQSTHGSKGLFGDLGPLAQLAALLPGPQQPFLLAANAANAASQGNLLSAGLNAFGAYTGGWSGLDSVGGTDLPLVDDWNFDPSAYSSSSGGSISGMGLTDPWAAGGSGMEMAGSVPNWTASTLDAVAPAASGVGASGAALPAAWQSALGVEGASSLAALNPGMLDKVRAAVTNPSTAATAGSALSRILKGEGALEDYLSLGLKALPGVLGAIGSSSQASSLKDLADKYAGYGAPSRDRFEASFQPGFSMASDPGYQDALDQSSKATLHSLSVNGNPAGSPNAWAQSLQDNYQKTAYPALQAYRSTNAAAGGLGTAAAAAPGLATSAIGANGQTMANLGGAFRDVTSDTSTLADLMKKLKGASDIFSLAT